MNPDMLCLHHFIELVLCSNSFLHCLAAAGIPPFLSVLPTVVLLFGCSRGGWPYLMLQCTFLVFALY